MKVNQLANSIAKMAQSDLIDHFLAIRRRRDPSLWIKKRAMTTPRQKKSVPKPIDLSKYTKEQLEEILTLFKEDTNDNADGSD